MASTQLQASATAAAQPGDILLVIHDFIARSPDELSLIRGELIELIERDDDFGDGWYLGKHLQDGRTGLFPEVYTKLAPASVVGATRPDSRMSRSDSTATHTQSIPETITRSTFSAMNRDSNMTAPTSSSDTAFQEHYDHNAPAPLNTAGGNQRSVSAPYDQSSFPPMNAGPVSQRSISMIVDNNRDNGQDSPVITETLGVIDEHITEMNTPRSSILAFPRPKGNDSGSEYSSHVDHRLSYINGHETDEEETLTLEEVLNWNPAQAAQYLHEIGVEQKHCDIFQEQEITGEVLLNLEKSELFMPELELGPIGRRLATWHKIKAFQEEVKSKKGTATPSVTGSTSASIPSLSSSFARGADTNARSPAMRYSSQPSPMLPGDDRMGISRLQSNDSSRPSAAAARDFNHSRRHSSMDYTKSDRGTPPISPSTQIPGHKQQNSFDKNWSMNSAMAAQAGGKSSRASTTLGFNSLGMASPGLPFMGDRRVMTTNTADLNNQQLNAIDLDRGYLSSGEAEGGRSRSKIRNLLRKSQPNSAAHSRQNSGNADTRSILSTGTTATKRHSRFGSAGSIFGTLNSQLSTHPTLGHQDKAPSPRLSRTESKALSRTESNTTRGRSISLKDTSSSISGPSTTTTFTGAHTTPSMPTAPLSAPLLAPSAVPQQPVATNVDTTPIVTKLDYTESPTSLASKSNPVSPTLKSEGFGAGALGRMTSTFSRSGKRSSSDAVTNVEKSQISAPIVPTTVSEGPLESPARTGSTSPSAASKSIEMDTTPDASIKGAAPPATTRTVSGGTATKRTKNKKETSAYKSLQATTPAEAAAGSSHSGWMYKKSAKMTSAFKARYFVLKDKRLSYFYSLEDKMEKGLIDINSHRVEQVEKDLVTSLYATFSGTRSGPASPANPPSLAAANSGFSSGGPFFFKLVPPRAGLSKAVQFTRPIVHFFAVDNYEEGREWFLALKKASIDRDETVPITTSYAQKTISLAKAQEQRQRPPALMNTEDFPEPKQDEIKTEEGETITKQVDGLGVGGLNLSYEHIPSAIEDTSANGLPDITVLPDTETSAPVSIHGGPQAMHEAENEANTKRPQSDQTPSSPYAEEKSSTGLRLVRSLSGGLGRQNEAIPENTAA